MKKIFLLVAVMVLASVSGFAQLKFSVYGGGAFPMGKLKAGELKDGEPSQWALWTEKGDQGYAGIGFNIGADVLLPLNSVKGLGFTLGADFFYNGSNSDIKKWISELENSWAEENIPYSIKRPKITNVPIMLGARYLYEISDNLGIFCEAATGLNIRMITSLKGEIKRKNDGSTAVEEYIHDYKSAITFAFKAGAGIMLAKHFSIGLDFYGLGSAQVIGTQISKLSESTHSIELKEEFKSNKLSCSELALRVGYHF